MGAAEEAFRKATTRDKAQGGLDDVFGLVHQNNLAGLLCRTGRKNEAEQIYRHITPKMKDEVQLA